MWFVFLIITWAGTFSIPLFFVFADRVLFDPLKIKKKSVPKTQISPKSILRKVEVVEVDARAPLLNENILQTEIISPVVDVPTEIVPAIEDPLLDELTLVIAMRREIAKKSADKAFQNEHRTRAMEDNLIRDLSMRVESNARERSSSVTSQTKSRRVSFRDDKEEEKEAEVMPMIPSQDELYEASAPERE